MHWNRLPLGYFFKKKSQPRGRVTFKTPSPQETESVQREMRASPSCPLHGQSTVRRGGQEDKGVLWVAVGGFWVSVRTQLAAARAIRSSKALSWSLLWTSSTSLMASRSNPISPNLDMSSRNCKACDRGDSSGCVLDVTSLTKSKECKCGPFNTQSLHVEGVRCQLGTLQTFSSEHWYISKHSSTAPASKPRSHRRPWRNR